MNLRLSGNCPAPAFTISPSLVQVWESDDCDNDLVPINPRWLTHQLTLVSSCGGQSNQFNIAFSESGYQIYSGSIFNFDICPIQCDNDPCDIVLFTCEEENENGSGTLDFCPEGCTLEDDTGFLFCLCCLFRSRCPPCYYPNDDDCKEESALISSTLISYNTSLQANGSWETRYRREYEDFTFKEIQSVNLNTFSTEYQTRPSITLSFELEGVPTCREADATGFCGCFNENSYNVIDIESLDSYEMPPDGCDGRPLDIDVVCGRRGQDFRGDDIILGGVTMYYAPFSNTVPVINNVAYDTTDLPAPPPGKINVIIIYKASTRNQIREFTCSSLKFATIRDDWRENPVLGPGGRIGAPFTSSEQNVNFNWPYNDLYFSEGCPGGDTVNLVPC
jgi:hypothetical protein